MRSGKGTLKCLQCGNVFSPDTEGEEIRGTCPKCKLQYSGAITEWVGANLAGVSFSVPVRLRGRFEIRLHQKAGKEA